MTAPVLRELVVDGFAGGGGASEGMRLALGRGPDLAYNHDALALAMHRINHPETRHVCRNIMQIDPLAEVGHRPVGLAWFSPDCKHHSKAKGGRPVKRSIRDLAWVVVLWARRARPRLIMLENVEEFRDWGPLKQRENGDWHPDPERKGQTFMRWVGELRRLGYKVEWRELRACDYGAPTIRKRLFLVARRDGLPIVWPVPTHGAPSDPDVVAGRKRPWRTAAEIIDWTLPCHSIFLTREEGRAVGVNRPLAENTMARIGKGCTQALVEASFLSHAYTSNTRGGNGDMRAPKKTLLAGGQHAAEVRAFLVKYYGGGSVHQAPTDPLHTVPTRDRFGLVTVEIDGEPYAIVDVGMRMLSPRELFRAQGFSDSYVIDRGMDAAGLSVALTKTAQVRMCGNSVSPCVAQALVGANYLPEQVLAKATPALNLAPLFAGLEAAE